MYLRKTEYKKNIQKHRIKKTVLKQVMQNIQKRKLLVLHSYHVRRNTNKNQKMKSKRSKKMKRMNVNKHASRRWIKKNKNLKK